MLPLCKAAHWEQKELMDENSGDFQASVRLLILYGMLKKPTYTCATEDAMQQISKHYCLA